jgi:hypothetical protein
MRWLAPQPGDSCVWRCEGQSELCCGCCFHRNAEGIAFTTSARRHQPMSRAAPASVSSCARAFLCLLLLRTVSFLHPHFASSRQTTPHARKAGTRPQYSPVLPSTALRTYLLYLCCHTHSEYSSASAGVCSAQLSSHRLGSFQCTQSVPFVTCIPLHFPGPFPLTSFWLSPNAGCLSTDVCSCDSSRLWLFELFAMTKGRCENGSDAWIFGSPHNGLFNLSVTEALKST